VVDDPEIVAGLEQFARLDNFVPFRNRLRTVAAASANWAGIPMPLDGQSLIIEPNFPNAEKLMAIAQAEKPGGQDPKLDKCRIRNIFWSWRWRCHITIWEQPDGRIGWGKTAGTHHLGHQFSTMGASCAWGLEQEARAVQHLSTLVPHHIFKMYLLTGMFLESSPRSGVRYLFRKLRPTAAITLRRKEPRILCTLCLHPIGYYEDSWAGAMCPTDDVIAHLMLMRGDEKMFWRRANQCPPWRPEAGL
jgi:hypothetical protein